MPRRAALAVAVVAVVVAAGPGTALASAPGSAPAKKLAPTAFADALRKGDVKAAQGAFAKNSTFLTPVLAQPITGYAHVSRLVAVLLQTFQGVHIVAELRSPGHFALAFDAHIGTQEIHIFDLITFDRTNHIVRFVSHGRPLPGVQALGRAVAPHLAEILA
jgi:hypothetical protein